MRLEKIIIFSALLLALNTGLSYGQESAQQPDSVGTTAEINPDSTLTTIVPDSTRATIGAAFKPDSLAADSTLVDDAAPLDIAKDRGLYIVTPDGKMQLRILGSVRYLIVYDDIDMVSKNNFLTYMIPTGEQSQLTPNYYNGLDQSRLGFEVTRRTSIGDVFIRLETDFAGQDGFRIRHAYGQVRRFLFGQTWSLFSHINALPTVVDFANPTGAVTVRTPQMRFTARRQLKGFKLSLGLEYSEPEFAFQESSSFEAFQLLPAFTARLIKNADWGVLQFSGIVPTMSGREDDGKLMVRAGWGASISTLVESWARGSWHVQAAGGQLISRFFQDLSGHGLDVVFDPESEDSAMPYTFGGYLSYEHRWRKNLYSSLTWGGLMMAKVSFMTDDTFYWGQTFRINTFWDIVDGSRVGGEYIHGARVDKGGDRGSANRVNVLYYYDF